MKFQKRESKTILGDTKRRGPLVVQRPFYPEGGGCHVYLIHPPGGVVAGDVLQISADLDPNTDVLITTPGATKFYRSAGAIAVQRQIFNVSDDACLEWLPQGSIYFPGAEVKSTTEVYLSPSSRLAIWDIQCFGRPTVGEKFNSGLVDSSLSIFRGETPIFIDRVRVHEQNRLRSSLLNSNPVVATFIMIGAIERDVEVARGLIAKCVERIEASATLIDDALVIRYLGDSTNIAQDIFSDIWSALRPYIMKKSEMRPRIWDT